MSRVMAFVPHPRWRETAHDGAPISADSFPVADLHVPTLGLQMHAARRFAAAEVQAFARSVFFLDGLRSEGLHVEFLLPGTAQ